MLADGGVYRYADKRGPNSYRYQTDFMADSSETYARQIAQMVENEFEIKPFVRKHPKANCFYVSTYKKAVWEKISKLIPCGDKTKNACFPVIDDLNYKIDLVRGLFDGEGSVVFRKDKKAGKIYTYPLIEFKVSSQILVSDISKLFSDINLQHRVFLYPEKNRFEIHIRSDSILVFKNLIGFKHPDKASRLNEAVTLIAKRRSKREQNKPNPYG